MTVNTISSIAEFDTNGVTTNYPFYFKFLANEDLVVTYINPVGASTTLTLGTHYTVNGAGNDAGGSVITVTALAGPGQLVVSREMDAFQQTSLRNQGKFLAETHEDVFDKLTMLIQQGFAIFTRALTRPFGRDYFFAENRRITSVKDPVDDQDAATKHSVQAYVASVLETGQGPINNAANVAYVYPDGVVRSVQSLATKNNPLLGAAGIGYKDKTVGAVLTEFEGPSPISVPPSHAYAGNRSLTPIRPEGAELAQQEWRAPVHIDLAHWDNPTPPAQGPIWKLGAPGLTSGAFWSQDSYILRNATIVDGPPQIATFEAWTGHMLTIENMRIVNSGAPGEWAFVGKGQNWWPIFRGNTWADVTNKHGNFFKFVDDDAIGPGGADMRYTGNSRCVISENRVKSLGGEVGGIGFYTSGVGNSYTDNACEGMLIGIQLGYPSTLTTIRKYYTELPFGNSASILIGDGTPAPNNLISDVVIDGAYANMHLFDSNAFIAVANSEVVIDRLKLDDISISNVSANPTPLVSLNDLNGQSISVGSIRANDVPVIPLTNSHVRIVDMYRSEIKALNGDFAYISVPTVTVPANVWTPLAGNWFQRSSAASSFERAGTGSQRQSRRQSRYVGYSYFGAGSNALCYQLPRANQYEGGLVTCQFLMQASSTLAMQVVVRVYNPDGSRLTLRTKEITVVNAMREFTVSFFDNLYANNDDSVIAVEIYNEAVVPVNVSTTGMRFNLGGFGLCSRSDTMTLAETQAGVTGRSWINP
ncbi:phage tail fiber protein [Pseudomonas fluorescens]|uniref:phage tail fiber domain-containing protein n=1 Tax=Pseudomonas fluorescens TaxID=294 RepID=UPI0005C4B666|nr:phage tail fiber protein [Pseudomonas fluorescens]